MLTLLLLSILRQNYKDMLLGEIKIICAAALDLRNKVIQ